MLIPNRDIATSEAANLALARLVKILADVSDPKKMSIEAVIPIFGIRRNATILRRVGKQKLRNITRPLRNSELDIGSYLKIRGLRLTSNADEADFPQLWEPWRAAIGRFNLEDELDLSAWAPTVDTFIKKGWGAPRKLSLANSSLFQASSTTFDQPEAAAQLWAATVLLFTDLSSASYLLLKGASSDAEKLISQLRTAPRVSRPSFLTLDARLKSLNSRGISPLWPRGHASPPS